MVLSFVVPVVFFSIFASIFGGGPGRASTRRVQLAVVDEDGSDASRAFVAALRSDPALAIAGRPAKPGEGADAPVGAFTRGAAEAAVRAGDFPVALVIPKG